MKTLVNSFVLIACALVFGFILVACGGGPTAVASNASPASDNGTPVARPEPQMVAPGADGNYANGYGLKAVTVIYSMTVTVLAAPGSLQQYSFQGSSSSYSSKYGGSSYGYVSGGTSGKGFIRARINRVTWHDPYGSAGHSESWTPLVNDGDTVMLKTTDSKASALGAGDTVTFLCREQNEFVDAVARDEIPTTQSVTRELDYCRMFEPTFTPPAEPTQ